MRSFKAILLSLSFFGITFATAPVMAKAYDPSQQITPYDPSNIAQINPCIYSPGSCPQSCGEIKVNTLASTGTVCTTKDVDPNDPSDGCGLDGALYKAKSCSQGTKIVMDEDLANNSNHTIDLNAAGFTLPLSIEGKKVTLDGGAARFSIKAKAGSTSFVIKGENNLIQGMHIAEATVTPIEIDAAALNADIVNVSSEKLVTLLKSNATDSSDSNVPVMVVPGTGGDYVVLAILPNDSEPESKKLRFCETSDATTYDCSSPAVTVSQTKLHQLLDPQGTSTDGTKIMVEFTLGGVSPDKSYMAFVKNTGKSVAVAALKPSLSTLYKDTDGDGLRDIDETTWFNTDPGKYDGNGDGISDLYNVIGVPGQKYVSITGADIYPAANGSGFLPGSYTVDPGQTPSADANADSGSSSSGCSMGEAAGKAPQVNALLAGLVLSGFGFLRGFRSRDQKK